MRFFIIFDIDFDGSLEVNLEPKQEEISRLQLLESRNQDKQYQNQRESSWIIRNIKNLRIFYHILFKKQFRSMYIFKISIQAAK